MSTPAPAALSAITREVEEFVAAVGWDQPPQLFALVPTAHLLREQPDLVGQIDPDAPLTPIAQEPLTDDDLGAALAGIMWPDVVSGCALAQEIVMLPPEAEADLPSDEADPMGRIAASHPQAREARLVTAALRDGTVACVMRIRSADGQTDEIIEHPELAPNLTSALLDTLRD
ncbi:MAG TPA: PPA1309 family protein [Actinokineospora sp.]|nr:PPA1309 family protein [Actinokineospora sp.]